MTSNPKRGRGRPSDPGKREAILNAAGELFFREGPEAINMAAVARRAGVSKGTAYVHFAGREALIHAVIQAQQEKLASALRNPVDDAAGLRRSLTAFGLDLLTFFCGDDYLLLERMMAARGSDPELAKIIYENGPLALLNELADLLEGLHTRGFLRLNNSHIAAEQLIGMWKGILCEHLIRGGAQKPTAKQLRQRVENGVDTFVKAFGVEKPQPEDT